MKLFGTSLGIGLIGLLVACSEESPGTAPGGSAGMTTGGGGAGTAGTPAGGGMAGTNTMAGAMAGGMAGTPAGGGMGGMGGAAGASGAGGGGSGGDANCEIKLGKALQFDGGKVDIFSGDLGTDLPGGNVNRTIELWAKFTGDNSWAAEGTFLETGKHVTAGNQILGLDMSGRVDATHGRFGPYTNGFSDNNGGDGVLYEAPGAAGWLHIAWSFDTNTGLSFTINGVSYPVQMGGQKLTLDLTPGIVTLGASQNFGANGWHGVMDEVKIWSVSKTPAEILANMKVVPKTDTPGLVAYYRFNEGSGTFTDDESKKPSHRLSACTGNSNICPAPNGAQPTWVDSDLPGPFTCAP